MDSALVEAVKRYPQLFKKQHKLYKNKVAVNNAWVAVAAQLNTTSKFKMLRTTYI